MYCLTIQSIMYNSSSASRRPKEIESWILINHSAGKSGTLYMNITIATAWTKSKWQWDKCIQLFIGRGVPGPAFRFEGCWVFNILWVSTCSVWAVNHFSLKDCVHYGMQYEVPNLPYLCRYLVATDFCFLIYNSSVHRYSGLQPTVKNAAY